MELSDYPFSYVVWELQYLNGQWIPVCLSQVFQWRVLGFKVRCRKRMSFKANLA